MMKCSLFEDREPPFGAGNRPPAYFAVHLRTGGPDQKCWRMRSSRLPLSISLHAPNDEKRSGHYAGQPALSHCRSFLEACRYCIGEDKQDGSRLSIALIRGVTDTPQEAEELPRLLRGMLCHVNSIPVNPVAETGFSQGSSKVCGTVPKALGGLRDLRHHKDGKWALNISGACGQLPGFRGKERKCEA